MSAPSMSSFDLVTNEICIGDPVMGLARYDISLPPGRYSIGSGALAPPSDGKPLIDLDGPYIYILDASKADAFDRAFHELGNECSYNMMEMEARHADLENRVGVQIAFFWEQSLAGRSSEGQYSLDVSKVVPAA
ncbi:hypothetical protein [Rubripirellula tenax]|uniref:hypothetical protein n=1 Tax=Rubripirellula tenax TaxID=2528015 RepID=UPI001C9416F6|nr:hypothetical protein [Rubripirellula tenax]